LPPACMMERRGSKPHKLPKISADVFTRSASDLLLAWCAVWAALHSFRETSLLDPFNGFSYCILAVAFTSMIGAFKFADVAVAQIPYFIAKQGSHALGSTFLLIASLTIFNEHPLSAPAIVVILIAGVVAWLASLFKFFEDLDLDRPRPARYAVITCAGIIFFLCVSTLLFSLAPAMSSRTPSTSATSSVTVPAFPSDKSVQAAQYLLASLAFASIPTYLRKSRYIVLLEVARRCAIAVALVLLSYAAELFLDEK